MCGEALFRSTTPKIRKTGPRKVNHALLKTIVLENPSMTQLKMAKTMGMSQAGIAGVLKKMLSYQEADSIKQAVFREKNRKYFRK